LASNPLRNAQTRGFVDRVKQNTFRYTQLFGRAIDEKIPEPEYEIREEDMDTFDISMQQRKHNAQMTLGDDTKQEFPAELKRK